MVSITIVFLLSALSRSSSKIIRAISFKKTKTIKAIKAITVATLKTLNLIRAMLTIYSRLQLLPDSSCK